MEELQLAERLIAYDTSRRSGLRHALDFIAGWLDGRGVSVRRAQVEDREAIVARAGGDGIRVIYHGHIDVVPGLPGQFSPRVDGNRLFGRGAYDMKAALACMMLSVADLAGTLNDTQTELVVVPDEERAEPGQNCTEMMVRDGLAADLVVCGEPTDMQIGVQAKGVLMLRAEVPGTAAHGATPWLGKNAVLRAVDMYRSIEDQPFAGESTPMFPRPSINLGRIKGGDAVNKVPDRCRMDIDVRYLPTQDPDEVLRQIRSIDPEVPIEVLLERPPADVDPEHPLVARLIAAASAHEPSAASVGRDGASDAVAFLKTGTPAVEFGPRGAGHHGPEEHVEIDSLSRYRRALTDFSRSVAAPTQEGAPA